MATQVRELYESAREKYRLRLHGGQGGLTNSAYWVYLAEDIQNMSFLKGGEMVITTGLFTQSGVGLYDFIHALVLRNCSGILINVGRYLYPEDITSQVVELCEANNLPIFTMPWEVHLVDIMQDYCILLMRHNQSEDQLNAALQSALYQQPVQDNVLRTLSQLGFPVAAEYRLIAIQNLQSSARITLPLNALGLKYHLFPNENLQILLYQAPTGGRPGVNDISDTLCYCDSVRLGIGDTMPSLADLGQCYKRARFALAAAVFWDRRSVIFDDLGLFQVLFCTSDPGLLQRIYQKKLGQMEQYDADHGAAYLQTLRTFLLSDCNVLETAQRLHTHRNTILYRIRKIKELLHTELDNSAIKFDLMMAFYIREYFAI